MTVDLHVPDGDRELVASAFDSFLEDIFQGRQSEPDALFPDRPDLQEKLEELYLLA